MAVPFLTNFMHEEWSTKQKKLRSANRMVSKGRSQALRHAAGRKRAALELCKANGIYVFVCVTYSNVLAPRTCPSVVPSHCFTNSVVAKGARGHEVHASVGLCPGSPREDC
jgi:hypothetical protein